MYKRGRYLHLYLHPDWCVAIMRYDPDRLADSPAKRYWAPLWFWCNPMPHTLEAARVLQQVTIDVDAMLCLWFFQLLYFMKLYWYYLLHIIVECKYILHHISVLLSTLFPQLHCPQHSAHSGILTSSFIDPIVPRCCDLNFMSCDWTQKLRSPSQSQSQSCATSCTPGRVATLATWLAEQHSGGSEDEVYTSLKVVTTNWWLQQYWKPDSHGCQGWDLVRPASLLGSHVQLVV